jgi:urease accessory protein
MIETADQLLKLLQLGSPALPVGAYSYSEGLETLQTQGQLENAEDLRSWLTLELRYGSIAMEVAVFVWVYHAVQRQDYPTLQDWNQRWSALRETEELRHQSHQMGRSLVRLGIGLDPTLAPIFQACGEGRKEGRKVEEQGQDCNFVIAFSVICAHWHLPLRAAVTVYLQSWVYNLMTAGVRLIPLGQTTGQQLLQDLALTMTQTVDRVLDTPEDALGGWSFGVAMASSHHENLYTRLFQS